MNSLVWKSLNHEVFRQFPELKQPLYADLLIDAEDGPYIVFGILFNQYLVDLIGSANLEPMQRVATFLEEMSLAKDVRISEMLSIEVLPKLLKSQQILDAYLPLLGANTKHRLRCLPPHFSRKVELPSFT